MAAAAAAEEWVEGEAWGGVAECEAARHRCVQGLFRTME
jgi:hypothetical protein